MKKSALLCLSLLSAAMTIEAREMQIGLSNDAIMMNYARGYDDGSARSELSWLHSDKDTDIVGAGYYANVAYDEVTLRLGGKFYWAEADGPDGVGMAGGGSVFYHITKKLSLRVSAHYSPSITSGKDIEHLQEIDVGASLNLNDKVSVFVAYNFIEMELEDGGDAKVHEGGYAGLKFVF